MMISPDFNVADGNARGMSTITPAIQISMKHPTVSKGILKKRTIDESCRPRYRFTKDDETSSVCSLVSNCSAGSSSSVRFDNATIRKIPQVTSDDLSSLSTVDRIHQSEQITYLDDYEERRTTNENSRKKPLLNHHARQEMLKKDWNVMMRSMLQQSKELNDKMTQRREQQQIVRQQRLRAQYQRLPSQDYSTQSMLEMMCEANERKRRLSRTYPPKNKPHKKGSSLNKNVHQILTLMSERKASLQLQEK